MKLSRAGREITSRFVEQGTGLQRHRSLGKFFLNRSVGCGGTFSTCLSVAFFGTWPVFDTHNSSTLKTCRHIAIRADREITSRFVEQGTEPPASPAESREVISRPVLSGAWRCLSGLSRVEFTGVIVRRPLRRGAGANIPVSFATEFRASGEP